MLVLQPVARVGAIVFFMIALFRYLQLGASPPLRLLSGPAFLAWLITLFLLMKILVLSGDALFFIQALLLVLLQVALLLMCIGKEQIDKIQVSDGDFEYLSFEIAIFLFSGLFVFVNLALMLYFGKAVSTFHGRFFGITANPQHTMMISVLCIPACVLFFRNQQQKIYTRAIAIGIMIGLGMIIYMTGSRTGFGVGLVVLCIGFLDKFQVRHLFTTVVGVSVGILLATILGGSDFWALIRNGIEAQYIDGRTDTRTYVVEREFSEFVDNWMTGVPLDIDGRLSFSESYWFSVLSNGGIIAALMASALFLMSLYTTVQLLLRGLRRGGQIRQLTSASACFGIILLSFAESILAGILAAYTVLASGYLAIAWNSISPHRPIKAIHRVRSP